MSLRIERNQATSRSSTTGSFLFLSMKLTHNSNRTVLAQGVWKSKNGRNRPFGAAVITRRKVEVIGDRGYCGLVARQIKWISGRQTYRLQPALWKVQMSVSELGGFAEFDDGQ